MTKSAFIALSLLAVVPAFAEEDKSTDHKTFSNVREVIVENIQGFIEVTGQSGNSMDAEIVRTLTADSKDRLALAQKEVRLDIKQEGGLVRMKVDIPFDHHGGLGYRADYDFKIKVPRGVKLELSSVNRSHIQVTGTTGEYKIHGVSTPVELRDVEGSGTVETVNGKIEASFAKTPKSSLSFHTVNGRIEVSFPKDLSADLKMHTVNGRMFTDFPTTNLPVSSAPPGMHAVGMHKVVWRSRNDVNARVGSGGPELSFHTVNGDVLIKDREK